MPLNPAPIQEPISRDNGVVSPIWVQWLNNLRQNLYRVPTYTVAQLPTGSAGDTAFVSDEVGGAVLAFNDGTNWRRVTDRAICS